VLQNGLAGVCVLSDANQLHLVVETPAANLALGMKWFLGDQQSGKELPAQMAKRGGERGLTSAVG